MRMIQSLPKQWNGDEFLCHLLHKFNENSAQLANIQPIFANQSTKTISLSENSSGNNAVKYLERIGLKGELVKVFVEKSSAEEITFYGICVELTRPKSINQTELLKQIQNLRFIEGSLSELR